MKDKIITLKYYDTMVDATVDQGVLHANGIDCFIGNQQLVQMYPMFNEIDDGLKIIVFEEDYDNAIALLAEYHQGDGKR